MAKVEITYEVVTADWIQLKLPENLKSEIAERKRIEDMYKNSGENFNISDHIE